MRIQYTLLKDPIIQLYWRIQHPLILIQHHVVMDWTLIQFLLNINFKHSW